MDVVHFGPIVIKNVWSYNLHTEFEFIRSIVDDYPYVGLGTMFPGPTSGIDFDAIVQNVNSLKVVQFGLTFMSADLTLPSFKPGKLRIWQFNFRDFNEEEDSVTFLRNRGINLNRLREEGVSVAEFALLLRDSGAVMNTRMRWVAFQGGHSFGFLIKALSGENVPSERADFDATMNAYFPVFYDVKHITTLFGVSGELDLEAAAAQFRVLVGGNAARQAGWDSVVACYLYLHIRFFRFHASPVGLHRVLYGLT